MVLWCWLYFVCFAAPDMLCNNAPRWTGCFAGYVMVFRCLFLCLHFTSNALVTHPIASPRSLPSPSTLQRQTSHWLNSNCPSLNKLTIYKPGLSITEHEHIALTPLNNQSPVGNSVDLDGMLMQGAWFEYHSISDEKRVRDVDFFAKSFWWCYSMVFLDLCIFHFSWYLAVFLCDFAWCSWCSHGVFMIVVFSLSGFRSVLSCSDLFF